MSQKNIRTPVLKRPADDDSAPPSKVARIEDPLTTLFRTAPSGDIVSLKKLLKSYPLIVNAVNLKGFTALYMAAQKGHTEIVQTLLDAGAHTKATTAAKFTPLHIAAHEGYIGVAQILIPLTDVNAFNIQGYTALCMAAQKGHTEIVQTLLDAGAHITRADGATALHIAEHVSVAQILIPLTDVNALNSKGFTALYMAAQRGHTEIVQTLLDAGAHTKATSADRSTALHIAAYKGHVKVAQILIPLIDVNARAAVGCTALHLVALNGNVDIAQLLIQAEADVNAIDAKGHTALYIVSQQGNIGVAQLLIQAKADLNIMTAVEYSALHIAAYNGKTDVVQLLIQAKANIHATNKEGYSALHLAAQEGHVEVVQLLIDHNANIHATTNGGSTALHTAAEGGYLAITQKLLAEGANINAKAANGLTALHNAAVTGHAEIVDLLIHHNADITITSNSHHTAWDYFFASSHSSIPFSFLAFSKYQTLPSKDSIMKFNEEQFPVMKVQGNLLYNILKILHHNFFKHNGIIRFEESINDLISTSQKEMEALTPGPHVSLASLVTNEIYKLIVYPDILPELLITQDEASPRYGIVLDCAKKYIMGEALAQNNPLPLSAIAMRSIKSLPNASKIIQTFYPHSLTEMNEATESCICEIDNEETPLTGEDSPST